MKTRFLAFLAAGFAVCAAPTTAFSEGHGATTVAGDLAISGAWSRPVTERRPGAAYFVIANRGDADDRLLSAASSAFGRIELHTHLMDNGVARMREVDAVLAAAGKETMLQPGGLHVMLFDAVAPLDEGATFPLTLTFERAGEVAVDVTVFGMAGPSGGHGGESHGSRNHDSHDHGTAETN